MITISHLTKIFEGKGPRVTALEDVNLEIGKGDIYGIIGMSGAGKSTLLRCLTLLERPTSGQIMLAGQDIASLSGAQLRAARRGMGVVFQGYNLLMQKTVAENVAFPLRLEKGYDRAAVQARVAELLAIVGLEDRARTRPSFPAGRSSAWPSPARWPHSPRCCCVMSPPARWTRLRRNPCWPC